MKVKATRVAVVCMECGRKFTVAPTNTDAECKCGATDLEVDECLPRVMSVRV